MKEIQESSVQKLDYLYKEYVRLSDRCASYVQSSFDDIRFYGAIGGVLAWTPIANLKLFEGENQSLIMFLGFIGILVIFIILSIYNALKQSLVVYYLQELRFFEKEIRILLSIEDNIIFNWADTYSKWRNTEVKKVGIHLLLVIILVIVVFPAVVLAYNQLIYAVLYLGSSLILYGIYLSAARIIFKNLK